VALSLGKQITSEVYFYLGSNDQRYWWLDRLDPDRGVAYIGTHANATPERATRLGAPVHPLDLLDLLGITPLPEGEDQAAPDGVQVGFSPDGESIMVAVPGRFGTRRVWFEPDDFMPRRVEILDAQGRVAVRSTLEDDALVEVSEDSRQRPLMASEVRVQVPGTPSSVRLRMSRLENRGTRQRETPFDDAAVLRAYPVDRVEDLDALALEEPRPEPAATGGARTPDRRLRVRGER
jgi:hypothetical protein